MLHLHKQLEDKYINDKNIVDLEVIATIQVNTEVLQIAYVI